MKSRLKMIKSHWVNVSRSTHHPKTFLDLLWAVILSSYGIIDQFFGRYPYGVASLSIDQLTVSDRLTDGKNHPPKEQAHDRIRDRQTDRRTDGLVDQRKTTFLNE